MNFKSIKEKTVVDYEIDKKKLEQFYGIKETKQHTYNIIQKKILFSKETSHNLIDKQKQYSHYGTFRNLATSEYDKEEMKNEIALGINLLKYSQSLRKELLTTLNIHKLLMPSNTPSEQNTIPQSDANSKLIQRKWKKVINTVKITDELLRKCRLLKIKSLQEDNQTNKTEFRLYSQLEKQGDMTDISKLNLLFHNQKEKILKGYNREKVFVDYIKDCKEYMVKSKVEVINQDIKDQYSQEIIYSVYYPRDTAFYFKYDSFMDNYGITPAKVKNNERDLYDHIYTILSKCNYVNFLSFLYSKNPLFKFIYDEFSDKDAGGDYTNIYDQIEDSFQDKDKDKEKNRELDRDKDIGKDKQGQPQIEIQDSQIIFNEKILNTNTNANKFSSNLLDEMIGSDTCLRIGIIPDPISDESLNKFLNKIVESNVNENIVNKIIQCQNLDFNYVFIIKNEVIKIFSPKLEDSQDDLNENNIISKIKPKNNFNFQIDIIETAIIEINNDDIPDEELLTINNQIFYLIKETSDEVNYYLFKIKLEYKKIFENALTKLKIKRSVLRELNKSISDDGGTIEFADIQNQLNNLKKGNKQSQELSKEDNDDNHNNNDSIAEQHPLFDLKGKLSPPLSLKASGQIDQQKSSSNQSGSLNEIKDIVKEATSQKYKPVGILK